MGKSEVEMSSCVNTANALGEIEDTDRMREHLLEHKFTAIS